MYVPFPKEEIDNTIKENSLYVSELTKESGSKRYIVKMMTSSGTVLDIVRFCVLETTLSYAVTNFDLSEEAKKCSSRYKHLYLIVAMKKILCWVKEEGYEKVSIYSKNPMMPEIFIEEGAQLRAAKTNSGMYRGAFYTSEKFYTGK